MNLNGLTEAEVQERLKDGRSNRGQEVKTKSKGQIIRENVLTLFNLLNLFLAIAIASVGSVYDHCHSQYRYRYRSGAQVQKDGR